MTIVRRFFVLQLLMLWQGGFLFYSSVVVPTGTRVLGGAFEQGKITRFVTADMNLVGAAALVLFVWELLVNRKKSRQQWRLLWGSWLVMGTTLAALIMLHSRMVDMVDVERSRLTGDRSGFRTLHRTYLWIITVQWGAGLLFAAALLRSWRTADRQADVASSCGL